MSRRTNDYEIDNKIQGIREDLQRLTTNYRPSLSKEQSPLEKYLEDKYSDPAFKLSEITESPFLHTKNSQDTKRGKIKVGSGLKNSYSADDLKGFEEEPLISPKFPVDSKPYVSKYVLYGDDRKSTTKKIGEIDPTVSTAYRDFSLDRNEVSPKYKINEKDEKIRELLKIKENLMKEIDRNRVEQSKVVKEKDNQIYELTLRFRDAHTTGEGYRKILDGLEKEVNALRRQKGGKIFEKSDRHRSDIENLTVSARGLGYKADELESEKRVLLEENTQLQQKLLQIEKEISYIENKSKSMRDEIKSLRLKHSEKESEILHLKKDKVEYLRQIDELKRIENQRNIELESAYMGKRELEDRIQELKQLLHDSSMTKYKTAEIEENTNLGTTRLKDQLKVLKSENVKLKSAIRRKPSVDEIKKATKKIEQLESAIDSIKGNKRGRSHSAKRIRDKVQKLPPLRPRSAGRERKSVSPSSKNLTMATYGKIVRELMTEFCVDNPSLLIPSAKSALHDLKNQSQNKKLVERIRTLIIDCSPPGTFEKNPSLKKVWKWIRRLIEEYLQMKKKWDQNETQKEIMSRLKKALGIEKIEEIPRSLTKLLAENENLLLILNKVKAVFRLSKLYLDTKVNLQELEKEIDKRL